MKINSKPENPFRMIGSYIGLIFGLIGSYLSFALLFALAESGKFTTSALLLPVLLPVAGFLIGWRIHVLFIEHS